MLKNTHRWLPGYFAGRVKKALNPRHKGGKIQIFLAICDHFEPLWNKADYETGLKRVRAWHERYPAIADRYTDSESKKPKYTFFYPIEEYRAEYLELLADLCHRGYGEVEVHLHHDNDTAGNLRETLLRFKSILANDYNLLSKDKLTGEINYGFIHGNWAINNSRPDGRMCGVDNELEVLKETGCYADFTMPSAPDITQTSRINSIYYDKGFLMVQGPLMLNWRNRKWGIAPRIENGFIGHDGLITPDRINLWINADIRANDSSDYVFIKLYTHGCQEKNLEYLLGGGLDELFAGFRGYNVHFVSAREMVNVIHAAAKHD